VPEPVALVGVHGGAWYGTAAGAALRRATVLVGARRHLDALPSDLPGWRVELDSPLAATLDRLASWRQDGQKVAVVVSGDPGFFGLVRLAAARLGSTALTVHPAPSSVALAFARAGLAWDDAAVVSAHGRPIEHAVEAIRHHPKVAVLTGPDQPPEELGRRLQAGGSPRRDVTVASCLGQADEEVWRGDVEGLALGRFAPLSIVILASPTPDATGATLAWGLPDDRYAHRAGMITKAEVRAVALGKLDLPAAGVLWDVGAGSGSIGAECARLAPGLSVYAIERAADDVATLRRNVAHLAVTVIPSEAPGAFDDLPDPDRVFVGGGGLPVLDAALGRLRPGGTVVATYAAVDRAAAAAQRLGQMVQVAVSRGVPIGPDGAWRLAADNPVFVCWGPDR
jgi:precorrin-6Y C5,15-methyltransferase (decarboxylating)